MSLGSTLSAAGFGLFALVFGALSFLLKHFLDPCNIRNLPDFGGKVSAEDCASYLAAPSGSGELAGEFVAFVSVALRIEGSLLLALAIGAAYLFLAHTYEARKGAAFVYGTVSCLCLAVDAGHAGFIPYGSNALMTPGIQKASVPLICLWAVLGSCFWASWFLTPTTGGGKQKGN